MDWTKYPTKYQLSALQSVSQISQVSRIALRRCSQNVFVFVIVIVIVIVFVFVFVFVIFLVISCLLITLNKCLKGQKSLGLLLGGVLKMSLSLSFFVFVFVTFFGHVMSSHHSEQMSQRSQVSKIALRRCSQNVFVIVFVFVFVFVNFLVMSCLPSLLTNVSKVTGLQGRSLNVNQ